MGTAFWIRRSVLVFVIAFIAIAGAHVLRGRSFESSIVEALVWAVISATIFIGARMYQSRKGVPCAICNDIPVEPGEIQER
jgi:hypothetical protein